MLSDLSQAREYDTLLLQAQCHNPCGSDLTTKQWLAITTLAKEKNLIVILDNAYLGLGESIDRDAYGLRVMATQLEHLFICNSCSKNFGLYRERTGSLTVTSLHDVTPTYHLLQKLARSVYSMPPAHGAHIVAYLLNSPGLYQPRTLATGTSRNKTTNSLQSKFTDPRSPTRTTQVTA